METKTRLRKACDACSIRKVKVRTCPLNSTNPANSQCDTSGPPCRSCASLDIPCTYERPSRRRGPPNRHAEEIKKRKLEDTPADSPASSDSAVPAISPANITSSVSSLASAESICSLSTLRLLIDDYFIYIHPLVPVPHEPTFRAAFERREDTTNPSFLALVASMIGTLVASFPRRPKLHLRAEAERAAFPHSVALVKKCHDVAVQARGTGYLDRNATVYDAAISYFLGLSAGYIYDFRRCRIYLAECRTLLHVYDLCREPKGDLLSPTTRTSSASHISHDPTGEALEYRFSIIERELGRRLFYTTLVGYRSLQQMGSTDTKLHHPAETPTERYPPLPLEVDDKYLFPTHVEVQPAQIVARLVGFNANVRVYSSYNSLSAWEAAFGSGQPMDWERQRTIIWECLQKAKAVVVSVPPELSVQWAQTSPVTPDRTLEEQARAIQYEIQKANIYASQLATRSYLVEKYWRLYETCRMYHKCSSSELETPGTPRSMVKTEANGVDTLTASQNHARSDYIGRMMAEERQLVIRDLFVLLRSINEVNMEPNGASFVSALLPFPRLVYPLTR